MFCLLGGGGGLLPPRLWWLFRGGLAVGSLACWTLSEKERRRPSRIACDISFENDFISSSSSKSDSLVHVRDCTPSWVKELPGGVADDVIFPIRVVAVPWVHPKWGCFRCRYRNSSLRLSWRRCCCPSPGPVGVFQPITSRQKNWRDFQQVKVARSTTTSQLPSLTFV